MEALQRSDECLTARAFNFFAFTFLYNDLYWLLSFLRKENKNSRSVNDSIIKPNGEKGSHCFPFLFFIIIHKVSITVICLSQSRGNVYPVKGNHAITHKWGLTWCGHIPVFYWLFYSICAHIVKYAFTPWPSSVVFTNLGQRFLRHAPNICI